MITRKTGVALAMLLLAGIAGLPGADAAECPKLIGPDWSGETLSPDPADCSAFPTFTMLAWSMSHS